MVTWTWYTRQKVNNTQKHKNKDDFKSISNALFILHYNDMQVV